MSLILSERIHLTQFDQLIWETATADYPYSHAASVSG